MLVGYRCHKNLIASKTKIRGRVLTYVMYEVSSEPR
jgi:hypothetical protein